MEPTPGGEMVSGARFAGIGVQFLVAVLLGLYGGRWLDHRLDTAPIFLIVGVFVGAGGSFYRMYRALVQRAKP